jgi:hypothetical protein
MKNVVKQLFILAFILIGTIVNAQMISEQQAQIAAKTYLQSEGKANLVLQDMRPVEQNNLIVAYIINFKPSSFVIVSAEKQAPPVLAYSVHFTAPAEIENPGFEEWMFAYGNQVAEIIENNIKLPAASKEWDALLNGTYSSPEGKSVSPLLTTTWDQGTYYNHLCPLASGGPGGHVWAGCVATALGQVMKYHNHPEQGTGSHSYNHPVYGYQFANFAATTYNWNSMPNAIYSYDDDIAELLYHCAVSVDMDFGVNGSGASPGAVIPAVKNYFNYNLETQMKNKDSYSNTEWIAMLKEELDASRPLFSGGYNSSQTEGHAYVCDGYNNSNKFHFNWGWSGYYNGYFYVNNLNPGGSNFSYGQNAIFYMEPAGEALAYISLESNLAIINPNPLEFGESAILPGQVQNTGVAVFDGCIYLSLYDMNDNFVGDIDSKEVMVNPGSTKTVVFSNSNINFPVGTYEMRLYYQQTCTGDKLLVQSGAYTNSYEINIIDPNANMAPLITTLEANELGATYAGNLVFDDDNWTKGIFQIKYTDLNGDSPTLSQIKLSNDNGGSFTDFDMTGGEGDVETGKRYYYAYDFGDDPATYANHIYKFNFNDGNANATGEQDIEYYIPYLQDVLQVEDTVTNTTITFKVKYFHQGGEMPVMMNLQTKAPGSDEWIETAMTAGSGSVETGKWFETTFTVDNTTGDWKYRFVFTDEKSIALGSRQIYSFEIDFPNGVSPTVSGDDFVVYPNPMTDDIRIRAAYPGEMKCSIVDASGKTVLTQTIHSMQKIDVSNLKKGAYIIQIDTEAGNIRKLLIK